jgi:NADH dehydrogenase
VNFKKNSNSIVVVFGASGFVGRYIVSNLSNENWKIKVLVRNPINAKHLTLMGKLGQVFIIKRNICNYKDVDKIIKGADKVINLVGILEESSK